MADEPAADGWRYLVTRPGQVAEGLTMVYRLRGEAPLGLLEMAGGGVWERSEAMLRPHFRGDHQEEFFEVTREEAEAIVQAYVARGWFRGMPDFDA